MQTNFTLAQLNDPETARSEHILRKCVHCGFCTATCPTYVLLGDERDSPRGRIYFIKAMLEGDRAPTASEVKHIDRCLSCLSCMTTCPSGVNYMHLVDHARVHIEDTYRRPLGDRLMRLLLATVLPNRRLFRLSLTAARLAQPLAPLLESIGLKRMAAMLRLAPARLPGSEPLAGRVFPAAGPRRGRVALMLGCASEVLAPSTSAAAIRLLTRNGIEVVLAAGEGCCGSLVHHLGRERRALAQARNNIDVWTREIETESLDAILITASGCGTTVKDYGFMFRDDPAYADKAKRVSEMTKDITEYMLSLKLMAPVLESDLVVAYHSACSMQHGQQIRTEPKTLLKQAGFTVKDVPEGHICCGSAGTYNLLQPELARALRDRKVANIERVKPDLIATGNIGCITQIAQGTAIPLVHTVELLDWATGGPMPAALKDAGFEARLAPNAAGVAAE